MGLYKLSLKSTDISTGVLEQVICGSIDYEKDFENWLENSPNVLLDEEGNTLLWIGRQVRASIGDTGKYPDLIGIDSTGHLVIVELKKGKTPREVIAQILEYSAWASALSYDDLNGLACEYFKLIHKDESHSSRKHYPSGQRDLYYRELDGKYRLYKPEQDGKWNSEGIKISDNWGS